MQPIFSCKSCSATEIKILSTKWLPKSLRACGKIQDKRSLLFARACSLTQILECSLDIASPMYGLVCKTMEKVVGFAVFSLPNEEYLELQFLCAHPHRFTNAAHPKGVGSYLLSRIEGIAAFFGRSKIILHSLESSLSFYTERGLKEDSGAYVKEVSTTSPIAYTIPKRFPVRDLEPHFILEDKVLYAYICLRGAARKRGKLRPLQLELDFFQQSMDSRYYQYLVCKVKGVTSALFRINISNPSTMELDYAFDLSGNCISSKLTLQTLKVYAKWANRKLVISKLIK